MFKRKGWYVVLGVVVAAVVLLAAVGAAYAAEPTPPPDGNDGGNCVCRCTGAGGGLGMRVRRAARALVDATAQATGLERDEVVAALRDGQTLAQVAEENGADVQAVVDLVLADRQAALQQAVENGRLTQEQADQRLARLTERVTRAMQRTLPQRGAAPAGPEQ